MALDVVQLALEALDPLADEAAVGLELRLAGTAGVPMPPRVRDRCVHIRVRRGRWYSSRRQLDLEPPLLASGRGCAKMSMISADRSSTLQSSSRSRFRCWFGLSSSSTTSRLKSLAAFSSTSSAARPLPKYQSGSGDGAALEGAAHHRGPGGLGQRLELGQAAAHRPALVAGSVEADQEGAFIGRGEVDGACCVRTCVRFMVAGAVPFAYCAGVVGRVGSLSASAPGVTA